MKVFNMSKVKEGKYLQAYKLDVSDRENDPFTYEMVSRNDINNVNELGNFGSNAVCVFLINLQGEALLIEEYRPTVNRKVYDIPSGLIDEGETAEEAARRELMEETGVGNIVIYDILPPSFSSIGMSDESVQVVVAVTSASNKYLKFDGTTNRESIEGHFVTKEEARWLLKSDRFCGRAQLLFYMWINGAFDIKN